MFIKIITSSILLTLSIIGTYILFGLVYNLIERKNIRYINYTFGTTGILLTGIVGVSIHELSHYIMCKIFAHKVQEVKLFTPEGFKEDGTLGYVSHTYNRKSIYQNIGNFFIGIAPMVLGTVFLSLCLKVLLPEIYTELILLIKEFITYSSNNNIQGIFVVIKEAIFIFLGMFLSLDNLFNIRFWIFIFLMCSISSHMSLSKADLKNSSTGLICIFTTSIVVSAISLIFKLNVSSLGDILLSYNVYVSCLLFVGLAFALLTMCISYLFYKIKRG
ncbi:hypothetical protein CHL78_011050 [Romboutsia weinsteinii]|uniref:DUF3267 domain-containing protein n=1 Tax=Romboutsia weinsteinii TaxID=2020949 RepID=A0A371J2I8_9FIRM|nr:metalloprotease family protein [Romboutsia weinsteinii]RDY26999.1 hypothetical protein CHL78_011050 [Romboutsia weinsteinii]